jgi:hypothetical protein
MNLDNLIVKYKKNPLPNEDGIKEIGCIEVIYPTTPEGSKPKLCVPLTEDNAHYQEIMAWVAKGNTIEEAD